MFSYYVYILKCSDESYYTGITNDLNRQLKEHIYGKHRTCYTLKRRPLEIQFHETFMHVLQAIYFENKIKKWSRSKKEALIIGDFERFQILAECRNATHSKYSDI
ncbi:GIY-YIG nuclease family protein [Bizionia argentinensis JUB59]|uniref:GIY-YIG nuclease family protein n=1 Tax=Bizionia argentinensis JUB59 TaxID=1046627 RepID=A0A4U8UJ93_9FLAO|nr:GIY-YIG nuclease family protein [Bizionia argentinensis]TLG99050.1 GIY-YIG nuclease family protein [Bizionia argentinensis JUB59]